MASFSDVYWKKSLSYKIGSRAHEISLFPIPLILLGYFLYTSLSIVDFSFVLLISVGIIVIIDAIKLPTNFEKILFV
jgi:hypothetical protein